MKIKYLFLFVFVVFSACAQKVVLVDENGSQIEEISYDYLSSIKATECADDYMQKKSGWMIGKLESNRDIEFLTARGISEDEAKVVLRKKMEAYLSGYNKGDHLYRPKMKFMNSYEVTISRPSIDQQTGGLLFDDLFKSQSQLIISSWNDVSIQPSYEAKNGRMLDDSAPKYVGKSSGTEQPMFKHFQAYAWSFPLSVLNGSVLLESDGKIYLKLSKENMRKKIEELISSRRPITFTLNTVFEFDYCNDGLVNMKLDQFQLIDDSTKNILVNWKI